jgi:mannose-1-phosphate guanylyltransferase
VAPSDHLILDPIAFNKVCFEALGFVSEHNALVTLGIQPAYPHTGYGYIQYEQQAVSHNVYKVKTFTEKPELSTAKMFISSGDFLFVWQVKNIISAFEKNLPEMYDVFEAEKSNFNTVQEVPALQRIYPLCTNISIDFGIMEKADNVYVIPSSFGWSDLGSWNSAWENLEKDYMSNASGGGNVIQTPQNKLVVLQGMEDFIVVDTNDVLLICKREKEQDIKEYVAEVKRNKGDKYL